MNETDDPLTDQDKINLLTFWEVYNARNQPLLDDPWTPDFGHYPPNLDFTDPEDPAGQPDDHYYQAAGQEPPTEAGRQLYPIWGYCFAFILLLGSVAFLWAFFGYVLPWFIRVYVEMAAL